MKKILTTAILVLSAMAASAQVTGTVKYDYDNFEGSPWLSMHRAVTGLKYDFGALGAIDGGLATAQKVTNVRSNLIGYDVGYSNGFAVGPVGLNARLSYQHLNYKDVAIAQNQNVLALGGFDGFINNLSLAVTGSMKVTDSVTGFVGAEHIQSKQNGNVSVARVYNQVVTDGFKATINDKTSINRLTVGADFALTKQLDARVGYARTFADGRQANGLTTAVSYKF